MGTATKGALVALCLALALAAATAGARPVGAAGSYTVAAGDTLWQIAIDHGYTSWEPLYAANRDVIADPQSLVIGTVLTIPDPGDAAPAAAPVAPSAPVGGPAAGIAGVCGFRASWITDTIAQAAYHYGQSACALMDVAWCESRFTPGATNPSSGAAGLFQFMWGTWRGTPYADSSPYDAWASAHAAAWMWSVGRRGEWVC